MLINSQTSNGTDECRLQRLFDSQCRIRSSSSDSQSSEDTNGSVLSQISPFFDVKSTVYGGRGCFASGDISKGTCVLHINRPTGFSVVRPFRKEVCMWCNEYHDGRTIKHRLREKLYFCSEQCLQEFSDYDADGVLVSTLCAVEDLYVKCMSELTDMDIVASSSDLDTLKIVKDLWAEVEEWEKQLKQTKASKRHGLLPKITVEDYAEIKYVITTLYNMWRSSSRIDVPMPKAPTHLKEMTQEQSSKFEMEIFRMLQSSELDKVKKYPYLAVAYVNIYKFVTLVSPPSLLQFVTPQNVRDIIGRNLTNAFGIWSPAIHPDEEREFFGFAVYPSASFFNHSCSYNITKTRSGASYDFIADRDISQGEELCITYGINGNEPVEHRRKELEEWFFVCGCAKCMQESQQPIID